MKLGKIEFSDPNYRKNPLPKTPLSEAYKLLKESKKIEDASVRSALLQDLKKQLELSIDRIQMGLELDVYEDQYFDEGRKAGLEEALELVENLLSAAEQR